MFGSQSQFGNQLELPNVARDRSDVDPQLLT